MRGALPVERAAEQRDRIIPADAGSTESIQLLMIRMRDHPRGCGEHGDLLMQGRHVRGSSPRMRGAPLVVLIDPEQIRIIPADAGSTKPAP